jgi:thiol-disulfide isomerase/thioredoxin
MTKRHAWVLGIVAGCVLTAGCGSGDRASNEGAVREDAAPGPVRRGIPLVEAAQRQAAPAFLAASLAGEPWSVEGHRGKVVVVDFWATWCGPCRASIPHLVEIADQMGPRGVEVVGISLDQGGHAMVEPFVRRMGITYPVVLDGEARLAGSFGGVEAIPTFFLIDRQGRLAARVRGLVPKEALTSAIESLLSEG